MTNPLLWTIRVLWILLPLAMAPGVGDALDARTASVAITAEALLWVGWAVGLIAVLVPRGVSITVLRLLAPLGMTAAVAAAFAEGVDGIDLLGVLATALVLAVSLSPVLGELFIDGSSYGPERRLPLRPPAALLFGPVPLATLVFGAAVTAGPLLLAAEQWIPGGVLLVAGAMLAQFAFRSLHGLSRRWLVIVPGGVVVHDPLTLTDPVLLPKESLVSITPAETGTQAVDLTQRAAGLAVELRLAEPGQFALAPRGSADAEIIETDAVLVTPTRPAEAIEAITTAF